MILRAERALRFVLFVAASASVAAGSLPVGATESAASQSAIAKIPLPNDAEVLTRATKAEKRVLGKDFRRISYILAEDTTEADVDAFYAAELPIGDDFGGWIWCAPAPGANSDPEYVWTRGGYLLRMSYGAVGGEGADDTFIPEGRVLIDVFRYPIESVSSRFKACKELSSAEDAAR